MRMAAKFRRLALELGPDLGDVDDVGDVHVGDVGPAPRPDLDQALERQALDRLAQRRAPDLELAHELVLDQRRSRRQAQGDDPVAELEVGAIGDQPASARAG